MLNNLLFITINLIAINCRNNTFNVLSKDFILLNSFHYSMLVQKFNGLNVDMVMKPTFVLLGKFFEWHVRPSPHLGPCVRSWTMPLSAGIFVSFEYYFRWDTPRVVHNMYIQIYVFVYISLVYFVLTVQNLFLVTNTIFCISCSTLFDVFFSSRLILR